MSNNVVRNGFNMIGWMMHEKEEVEARRFEQEEMRSLFDSVGAR